MVPNYFLYPSKGSDVCLREILAQFSPNKHSSVTRHHLAIVETRLKSWNRRDCRELLEVHRNVIDVKSITFLVILLAPEDSFVTLHIRWHKRMLF